MGRRSPPGPRVMKAGEGREKSTDAVVLKRSRSLLAVGVKERRKRKKRKEREGACF
jgi:hypothetical protein